MEQCLTTNLNKNLFFQRRDYVEDIFGSGAGSKIGRRDWSLLGFALVFLEKNRNKWFQSSSACPTLIFYFLRVCSLKFKLIDSWHLSTVESHPISLKHTCFSSLQQKHLNVLLGCLHRAGFTSQRA